MLAPTSSRSVDPRLAAASGVMRDTVGAIHNLQHLLGSVRVGPKALARVVPDVHASCRPMILAAGEMIEAARNGPLSGPVRELGELVVGRMAELESTLGQTSKSAFRASDRLSLETALASVVRDLDGALELVELMVEASATGRVPVAVSDVIRESANRLDTGSGRGRRLRVTFAAPGSAVLVRVNPRLALRLFAFAVAIPGSKDGVVVRTEILGGVCNLRISPRGINDTVPPGDRGGTVLVAVPPLIDLSRLCACEVARATGSTLEASPTERTSVLSLPLDPG
ncbi:MAG TPA: hypothetical protein VF395_04130, partial [Polyangiaceae bacterium]